jgi:hypothetical protein
MNQIPDSPFRYRAGRHKTRAAARLEADGETLEVVILDVSRDGAKVTVPYPLMPGTAARLSVAGSNVAALVHWSRKGHAGLRFLDRLDIDALIVLEGAADDPFGFETNRAKAKG